LGIDCEEVQKVDLYWLFDYYYPGNLTYGSKAFKYYIDLSDDNPSWRNNYFSNYVIKETLHDDYDS